MKLTVNLDGNLLNRVVEITGSSTKTEAIVFALREVDRKARLLAILREGLGANADELRSMFDETADPERFRADRNVAAQNRVAESPREPEA